MIPPWSAAPFGPAAGAFFFDFRIGLIRMRRFRRGNLRRIGRQQDHECLCVALGALPEKRTPAVTLDDFSRDRKSETAPASCTSRFVADDKRREKLRGEFIGDRIAVVRDLDFPARDIRAACRPRIFRRRVPRFNLFRRPALFRETDPNVTAGAVVKDRVVQEIRDGAGELKPVSRDADGLVGKIDVERYGLALEFAVHRRDDAAKELGQFEFLAADRVLRIVETRVFE